MSKQELEREIELFSWLINTDNNIKAGSPSDVYMIVCNKFNVYPDGSKYDEYVFIRQLSHTISRMLVGRGDFYASLATIGYEIGEKDHSTVMNSIKTITRYVKIGYRLADISDALTLFGISLSEFDNVSNKVQHVIATKDGKRHKFQTLLEAAKFVGASKRSASSAMTRGCRINKYKLTFETEKI